MTLSVKHKFTSAKSDGLDTSLVQPSNWNDDHDMTCAANSLLGNATDSTGAVAEISLGSLGESIIAANDIDALITAGVAVFTTGDVKLTFKTTADTGFVMANDGTIGPSGSTATFADDSAEDLYTLLWNNVDDAQSPVTGGRGGSAAADWVAKKPLAVSKMLGRALAVSGAGTSLTSRVLGLAVGEETHALITAELAQHNHGVIDPGHTHTGSNGASFYGNQNVSNSLQQVGTFGIGAVGIASSPTGVTIQNTGSGTAHNNMQPSTFLNVMIKL